MRHSTLLLALVTLGLAAARSAAAQQRAPAVPASPPSIATGALIGRVVDAERCTPVRDVGVTVDGTSLADATDADGRFRFPALRAATYTVVARREGYWRNQASDIEVAAGGLGYAELRVRQQGNDGPYSGLAVATPANASYTDSPPRITAARGRFAQGSLVRIRVAWPATSRANLRNRMDGELAGEPLHFARAGRDAFEALAAIPVDAPDTLRLRLGPVYRDGNPTQVEFPVQVARGDFPVERLRVAPEFGREPDLALAERLERESEKARDVGCRAHFTPRLWTRPFVRPRPGRVTSTFGRAREYNGTVTGRHSGTDFAGAVGAPVRAVNRGVVRLAERFYLGGNVVYVDHGGGLVSAYMHLSRTDVAVGDTVARGQVIGGVGSTGRVTGPHLHWVVRYGRTSVDPLSLLAIAGESPSGSAGRRVAESRGR